MTKSHAVPWTIAVCDGNIRPSATSENWGPHSANEWEGKVMCALRQSTELMLFSALSVPVDQIWRPWKGASGVLKMLRYIFGVIMCCDAGFPWHPIIAIYQLIFNPPPPHTHTHTHTHTQEMICGCRIMTPNICMEFHNFLTCQWAVPSNTTRLLCLHCTSLLMDLESLVNTLYDKRLMNTLWNRAGWKSTFWMPLILL